MKKFLSLVLIFISFTAFSNIGMNPNYTIISQTDYEKRISKYKDVVLQRYIVVPDFDKNYKEIFDTKDEEALLSRFSYMLRKNKSRFIDRYIANCDDSKEINYLIKGLYFFSKGDYLQAMGCLEHIRAKDHEFLKYLLIADCKFELLINKSNFKSVIQAYQTALDIADNEQDKSIVNNRIKYIKYR